ncbi:ATP-binding protein [Terriglobus sp. TAA 43]|uniref:PAS domain-containing sensor histidine kinase n=1 Tax=Terriglobus sp. TAA 43 TaxID=278961 RepID=UPI0018DB7FC7|nr:ATP-binding protein [Terriglobus sp. TAA 43]
MSIVAAVTPGTFIATALNSQQAHQNYLVSLLLLVMVAGCFLLYRLFKWRRRHASEALHDSEVLKEAVLNLIQGDVAVLDRYGVILEVNRRWTEFSERTDIPSPTDVKVGTNYLRAPRKDVGREEASTVLAGVQDVLDGSRNTFESECSCSSPVETRWFRITAVQLSRPSGGALVIHFDITECKRAELERKQLQEEAAFLNRATEMGQLAATLAHELAQPMAAILTNAQAALRIASKAEPDLAEICAALHDVVEDDQRARTVLNNVRALLKKQPVTLHKISLNKVVTDVTLMIRSLAQAHSIQIETALPTEDVYAFGDEIPLQQVLLNLATNAIDAMSEAPIERRILTLRLAVHAAVNNASIMVEDQGPGVRTAIRESLFQPFVTTKKDGLGMGLAICRRILDTLGGSIELQDSAAGGATFQVDLPLAP